MPYWQVTLYQPSEKPVTVTGAPLSTEATAAADAEAAGRKGLVLTCKERLIPYYSKFGYVNEGLSVSMHGNAVWYEMRRLCRIKQ